ncbi:PREDICTED: uncharacterized protein LOC104793922 [Camelina sativa]|uniref:Uncharacterized protein LOC104793922 n=1 Tax=Camelina sativa TaxID=90675 RepID=A0ABM0ZPE2_CAMSA|nr:PREDICTED: uncharacterized protein LOC104793922 [Camelina sativa]
MANSISDSAQQPDQYNNPYFLHDTDHAGLVLVSNRLTTGVEFNSWRRSMRMALNVRNKLGFIDGTISKPSSDHRDYGSWSRCNDMVSTWLMNSVSKKIGQSLLFIPTAEEIWKDIISRFKQDDAPRVYKIEQKLSSIHQGAMDVTAYYTELVTLWEELKNYVELSVCTCGKCECNAALLWEKLQQRSRVKKFLMGLNDSYEATRRHILMIKPMPSIENAFHMVTEDERQQSIAKPTRTDGVVFQTSGPPTYDGPVDNLAYAVQNSYRPKQSRPLCTCCGMTGHVVQKCFKLHGYPPGYIPGFKSVSSGFHSHRMANPQSVQPRAHAVANNTSSSPYVPPPALNVFNLDVNKMTSDQMQTLIQKLSTHMQLPENQTPSKVSSISEHGAMAIQSSAGTVPFPSSSLRYENHHLTFQHQCLSPLYSKLPHGSWIIDSGATTHFCSDLALFRETVHVSGVTVSLPDDTRVAITHTGTVHLSHSLILHDVLHVPYFKFNLISVSSLLKASSCSAHFFPNSCFIQEFIHGLMIGKGILLHNLYIL